jgi:hypothetical protein
MHGIDAPAWKSAMKADKLMAIRIKCFFVQDQLRGSFASSDGWGTKTV